MSKTHGTNVHFIDGVKYVEVDRKAEVGEKVIVVNWEAYRHIFQDVMNGEVLTVKEINSDGDILAIYERDIDAVISSREHHVLEPLESEECCVDTTQASPEVIDLLSNLARRVTSLERKLGSIEQQLRDTQRNVEKWAEELANNYATIEEVDYVHNLAERTQTTEVEAVTFDKFLDSVAEKVAQKLVGGERQ